MKDRGQISSWGKRDERSKVGPLSGPEGPEVLARAPRFTGGCLCHEHSLNHTVAGGVGCADWLKLGAGVDMASSKRT